MSTRCLIGKQNKDNTITYIYCHHDGYLSWVGQTLIKHYQEEEKVDKLLALGDISSIGHTPVAAPNFDNLNDEFCRPYSLRGEDCPAITVKDEKEYLSQDRWQEYTYLYKDGKWCVYCTYRSPDYDSWSLVGVELSKELNEEGGAEN